MTNEVRQKERDLSRINDYSWQTTRVLLKCDSDVWHEGRNFDRARKHEQIVRHNRQGFCFFWRWHPGMMLDAARKLREKETASGNSARDRRLVIVGLCITALALVVEVVYKIVESFAGK